MRLATNENKSNVKDGRDHGTGALALATTASLVGWIISVLMWVLWYLHVRLELWVRKVVTDQAQKPIRLMLMLMLMLMLVPS